MPTLLSRTQPAPGPRVKHEPEPISRNILQAFVFVTRGGIWNPASHNRSRSSYIQKRVHGLLPRSRIHAPMWTETYDTALGLGQAFASQDFFLRNCPVLVRSRGAQSSPKFMASWTRSPCLHFTPNYSQHNLPHYRVTMVVLH